MGSAESGFHESDVSNRLDSVPAAYTACAVLFLFLLTHNTPSKKIRQAMLWHSLSLCGLPDVDGISVSCSTAGQLTRSVCGAR
jgi:hypothetical protein